MTKKLRLLVMLVISFNFFLFTNDTVLEASQSNRNLENVNYSQEVIYQIVTDRFKDGDPSNNPSGELFSSDCSDLTKYCGGDWQGIIEEIESGYLPNMGITTLWISPPVENVFGLHPEGFASYHGYWARDFKRPNPFMGDINDFTQLINTAHAHDIKIVIDFVPNHTSPVDIEDGSLYNDGDLLGSYSNDQNDYFYKNGGSNFSSYEDGIYRNLYDLASLNLHNPVIDAYLKDAIRMWLDLGVDGIRVDAVAHMPLGWQKTFTDTIYHHNPVFIFGEWFTGTEGSDEFHHFANHSGMSVLDFRFAQVVQQVLRNNQGTMYDLYNMLISTEAQYDHAHEQVTFIDNHDINRFTINSQSQDMTHIALAFLLTSRGVPTIYYGTEAYLTGEGDPNNRKMLDTFDQTTTAYQVIQKLAPLRKLNNALSYGDTTERWINDDVLIFERSFNGDYALVAINKNLQTSYNIEGLFTDLPEDQYEDELNDILSGQSITVNKDGSVNPFELAAGEVSVWQYTENDVLTPKIGHVGPSIGRPGDTIKISGTGFGEQVGNVKLGNHSVEIDSWTNEEITVVLPNNNKGLQDFHVIAANEQESNGYNFELLSGKQIPVRFVVNNAHTYLGQNVYLVGNVPELGTWDPLNSIGPMFNQVLYSYPTWYYDVNVPADTDLEFKFVIKDPNGNVTWEGGMNHHYSTPSDGTDTIIVDFQK